MFVFFCYFWLSQMSIVHKLLQSNDALCQISDCLMSCHNAFSVFLSLLLDRHDMLVKQISHYRFKEKYIVFCSFCIFIRFLRKNFVDQIAVILELSQLFRWKISFSQPFQIFHRLHLFVFHQNSLNPTSRHLTWLLTLFLLLLFTLLGTTLATLVFLRFLLRTFSRNYITFFFLFTLWSFGPLLFTRSLRHVFKISKKFILHYYFCCIIIGDKTKLSTSVSNVICYRRFKHPSTLVSVLYCVFLLKFAT